MDQIHVTKNTDTSGDTEVVGSFSQGQRQSVCSIRDLVGQTQFLNLRKVAHDNIDRLVPGAMPPSVYLIRLGWYPTGTFKWLHQFDHAEKAVQEGYTATSVGSCGNNAAANSGAAFAVNRERGSSLQSFAIMGDHALNAQAATCIRNIEKWGGRCIFIQGDYKAAVEASKALARDGRLPTEPIPENEIRARLGMPILESEPPLPDFSRFRIYDANTGSVNSGVERPAFGRVMHDAQDRFRSRLLAGARMKVICTAGDAGLALALFDECESMDWSGMTKPTIVLACDDRNPLYRAACERSTHLREFTGRSNVDDANTGIFVKFPQAGEELAKRMYLPNHVIGVNSHDIRETHRAICEANLLVPCRPITDPAHPPEEPGRQMHFRPLKEGVTGIAAAIKGWTNGRLERRHDEITLITVTGEET